MGPPPPALPPSPPRLPPPSPPPQPSPPSELTLAVQWFRDDQEIFWILIAVFGCSGACVFALLRKYCLRPLWYLCVKRLRRSFDRLETRHPSSDLPTPGLDLGWFKPRSSAMQVTRHHSSRMSQRRGSWP